MAIGVGAMDYFLSADILILYLAPIFLASWYGGSRRGLPVALYCAAAAFVTRAWFEGDHVVTAADGGSMLIRLAAYLLIAQTIARLRTSRQQEEELANFIVHDLRSPVASAISGLLTLQQSEDMGSAEREMVDLALVSSQRALGLVNSMLDVSKLESGSMPVEKEAVEIGPFVEGCLAQLELWARSEDVRFETYLQVELGYFDTQLTGRVLVNLLGNALRFSPQGGTIRIFATLGHGLRLAVSDEGPGIPPEAASMIFEPFAQVQGTQGGTGLGLTFCRLAVQAQGGRIRVEPHHGKGATVSFTLPQPHHIERPAR